MLLAFILLLFSGAGAYVVHNEQRFRRLRCQVRFLTLREGDLRRRFGQFMIYGGHELVKSNVTRIKAAIDDNPEFKSLRPELVSTPLPYDLGDKP